MFFKSARLSYFILFKTLFNSTTFFSAVYSSILLPTNYKIKCTFVKMNFKKHTSILLAALILLANIGLSFVVHYCKNEIASVSFQYQEEAPCVENVRSCCAKENSQNSCCSNKLIKVEKKTDNILVKNFQFHLEPAVFNAVWKPNFVAFESVVVNFNGVAFYCDSHAPPRYKLYCQLVFYA